MCTCVHLCLKDCVKNYLIFFAVHKCILIYFFYLFCFSCRNIFKCIYNSWHQQFMEKEVWRRFIKLISYAFKYHVMIINCFDFFISNISNKIYLNDIFFFSFFFFYFLPFFANLTIIKICFWILLQLLRKSFNWLEKKT